MPNERSIYRKIQFIIDFTKSSNSKSLHDLHLEIRNKRNPMFYSYHYDQSRDEFVEDVSERAIWRSINLCRKLNLISVDTKLTKTGREALKKTRFDRTVIKEIERVLIESDVDIAKLNRKMKERLNTLAEELPTAKNLWNDLDASIGFAYFSSLMTLLAHCGGAKFSQSKIYLETMFD